ncbi:putative transporter [Pseudoloma neurophilia]|uniref:Putative transporter n=1 Tax=Pseudoloma neurophilia TaxID=146866 RepID=A0A0R0LS67_9MICR|nr:putative transporter [Pseudoloma neurophilia]
MLMRFFDNFYKGKITLCEIYISFLPILCSAISMYVHKSGSYLKTNFLLSSLLIFTSVINLIILKVNKKWRGRFEFTLFIIFAILATQFSANIFEQSIFEPIINLILKYNEKSIIMNILPVIISFTIDLIISFFIFRETAVPLKIISSFIVIIFFIGVSDQLYFSWIELSFFLFIPSIILTFCLPSENDLRIELKKYKRIQVITGTLILIITTFTIAAYLIQIHLSTNKFFYSKKILFGGVKWIGEGVKSCKRGIFSICKYVFS